MSTPKKNTNQEAYKKITGGYVPVTTPKNATGMQGVGITGTDRNVAKEMEAFKLGYSADYIASRGGLNSQGYFNDVSLSGQLNAAEQKAVTLANGTVDTPAMARILQKKAYDEAISQGGSSTEVLNKLKNQWGNLFDATVADTGGAKDGTGDGTGTGTSGGTGSNLNKNITDETRDAFAILTNLFASYGLESLASEITGYMTSGLTSAEALVKLKTNPTGAYAKRFAGNFERVKRGLNVISEAEYVNLESAYANTLKAYGLNNMVSLNREDNYKKFADYIAGDISADEFNNRIKTVVERVKNAEPSVKATLQSFYPEITDNDLIGYFLNPKENLPKLQEKVTASEIGAAAAGAGAGLTANLASATDLARYGVDQKMAREGYSTIAGVLPTASKLGNIYGETGVKYAQAEGEAEVFKGNQDAASKRRRLASMERAAFSGSSGTNQGSLSRSTQGKL